MAVKKLIAKNVGLPVFDLEKISYTQNKKSAKCDVFNLSSHERARQALEFGLKMREPEFNIFVLGNDMSGRVTATMDFLKNYVEKFDKPDDWVYLNNFKRPHCPIPFRLPAGQAIILKSHMRKLICATERVVRDIFESTEITQKIEQENNKLQQSIQQKIDQLRKYALSKGLDIKQTEEETVVTLAPKDGKLITFENLTEKERKIVDKAWVEVRDQLQEITIDAQKKGEEISDEIMSQRQHTVDEKVSPYFSALEKKFKDIEGMKLWIGQLKIDVLNNLNLFTGGDDEEERAFDQDPHERYGVNILVSHAEDDSPNVIIEPNPTYENIFGKIKYRSNESGSIETNFTLIRPGALHKANGGILVFRAESLGQDKTLWTYLKSVIRDQEIRIEELHRTNSIPLMQAPEPLPIPLDVQIVIIGAPRWFYGFFFKDQEFPLYFKIRVDIDPDMPATKKNIDLYTQLLQETALERYNMECDKKALQFLLGYSTRWTEHRLKLSSQYELLQDIVIEGGALAKLRKAKKISEKDIQQSLLGRHNRDAWLEERTFESIRENFIDIDVKKRVVGQVNALTVLPLDLHSFGTPTKVTARTYMGTDGVINIDRSTNMTGLIQQKAVFIIEGFLNGMFAKEFPLSFNASLTFEQSYEEIEGDSASLAEVSAILSSLAELPIYQEIAVTGSVNQMGKVQVVGGVIEKIEGFYKVCESKGLTGEQGVIIPKQNEVNISLRDEVRRAIAKREFHVWSVENIADAVEILTGVEAGTASDSPKKDGVFNKVYRKLKKYDNCLKER